MKKLLVAVLLLFLVGCPTVHHYDQTTVENIKANKAMYLQDAGRADVTQQEKDAAIAVFDACIEYEEAKKQQD